MSWVHRPASAERRPSAAALLDHRANIELERIGDYAVTIAREALQLSEPPRGLMAHVLERVGGETQLMLHQAIRALNELNAEMTGILYPARLILQTGLLEGGIEQ